MVEKQPTSFFDAVVFLGGAIAAISVAVVAIFAIFASDHMMVCAYIVGALCVMGLGLGVIMSRHASQSEFSTRAAATDG